MSAVFARAAVFIAMIFMASALRKWKVLRVEDVSILSKLVTRVTLPAAIIYNFSSITMTVPMLAIVAVGFLCSLLFVGIGYLLFAKEGRAQKAFGLINASGYNIGCFAMPFAQSFLGPLGIATTSLFDTGNAIICTGSSYAIAVMVSGKGEIRGPRQMLKQIFSSVPIDCYLIMTVLALFQIRLPQLAIDFAGTVSGANAFLSMTMIGLGLKLDMSRTQFRAAAKILGTRLLVSAVLSVLMFRFAPFEPEIRSALAVVMFAPVSSLGVAYTSMLDGDISLASAINSMSIFLGIIGLTAAIMIYI